MFYPAATEVTLDTSVELLKEKIVPWMVDQGLGVPWFPGEGGDFTPPSQADLVNVVLFGNFLGQFLQVPRWPEQRYRLWVLGHSARQALHHFFGIPLGAIGVIPRLEIFPPSQALVDFPFFQQDWSLVYAGRFSFSKNFGLLLRVASALQCDFGLPVELKCLGSFDDVGREDLGLSEIPEYEERAHNLLASLSWNLPPTFLPPLAPTSWVKAMGPRSVYINLSQFYMDDFGVALAQVQALGLPAFVSGWGGHWDALGPNCMALALPLPQVMSEDQITAVAKQVAQKIYNRDYLRPIQYPFRAHLPVALSFAQIKKFYSLFLSDWGIEALALREIGEAPLEEFALRPLGRAFFKQYHQIFSGMSDEKVNSTL